MTIDEMIAVLTAAKAGKPIQYESPASGKWVDIGSASFSEPMRRYRVKPEPREWVIRPCILDAYSYAHSENIKVREVLPS